MAAQPGERVLMKEANVGGVAFIVPGLKTIKVFPSFRHHTEVRPSPEKFIDSEQISLRIVKVFETFGGKYEIIRFLRVLKAEQWIVVKTPDI
jgi:hypothetical protein